jgi:uncharacterized protein
MDEILIRDRRTGPMYLSPQDAQREVIAFLSDPRSHGTTTVDVVSTHAALVFLAGEFAYKLKRAVALPYLDFSTVELRRQICMRELVLNQRTAPSLYLGLAAIVQGPAGLLLVDDPEDQHPDRLDTVVVMRRFADTDLLDRMAETGRLTPSLMVELAEVIASFHDEAEPQPDGGGAAGLRKVLVDLMARLAAHTSPFPADRLKHLADQSLARLDQLTPLLDRRCDAGYVRRCHGDLHLRNLVMLDGSPVPFDCLEFDESMAVIDVLYDLAFLLMDMEHRRLRPLANIVLNRYLELSGDLAGLTLLPLFMAIRAAVRADTTALKAGLAQGNPAADLKEALSYFDLALDLLNPPSPRLIAIGGLSGTGKTTLARQLAPDIGPAPGAVILRSDVLRKRLLGVDELTVLPPEGYCSAVSQRVFAEIVGRSGLALDSRHAVICDAVFALPEQRTAIEETARSADVIFSGLWLVADQQTQMARVRHRTGDASDATADIVRRQAAYDLGEMRWDVIAANGAPDEVAAVARRLVSASKR